MVLSEGIALEEVLTSFVIIMFTKKFLQARVEARYIVLGEVHTVESSSPGGPFESGSEFGMHQYS